MAAVPSERNTTKSESRRSWTPNPPSSLGIYLFCSHQGAGMERFVVEHRDGRLRASHIGEGDWRAVRSMMGWWCREAESTGYSRHRMESDDPELELMTLEWLL